ARFCLLQGDGNGSVEQQKAVVAVAAEGIAAAFPECLLVASGEIQRDRLDRVVVREGLRNDERACRRDGALDRLASDLDELAVDGSVVVIDLLLVAALDKSHVRKRAPG